MQEVVLTKKVVILCGDYGLTWQHFHLASSMIFSYLGSIATASSEGYVNKTHPIETTQFHERLERLTSGASHIRVIATTAHGRLESQPGSSFYDILRRHMTSKSTDPLDKVYTFLGLANINNEGVAQIPINYTMSPSALYRFVAKQHIRSTNSLSILRDCYGIRRPEGFSSWAPLLSHIQ